MNSILPEAPQEPVDFITLKREPFEMDYITIVLQDHRSFKIEWIKHKLFCRIHQIEIPPLALDALFNFNEIRYYPVYPGYPKGKVDIR